MKGSGLGFMVLPHMNASTSPLKKLHFMKVASKKLTKSVSSVSMVLQKRLYSLLQENCVGNSLFDRLTIIDSEKGCCIVDSLFHRPSIIIVLQTYWIASSQFHKPIILYNATRIRLRQ